MVTDRLQNLNGRHLIADFFECQSGMEDADGIEPVVHEAVARIGAHLLSLRVHAFDSVGEKSGFTAAAILSDSHLAIHTWPERNYVAIDIFTCGSSVNPVAGLDVLKEFFRPLRVADQLIDRSHASASLPDELVP